jgi:hypothetical protein
MALLKLSKNKTLVEPLIHDMAPEVEHASPWKGPRTGKYQVSMKQIGGPLDSTPREVDVLRYLSNRALSSPLKPPTDLLPDLKTSQLFGEYLHILRPLIYGIYCLVFGYELLLILTLSIAVEEVWHKGLEAMVYKSRYRTLEHHCNFGKDSSFFG